MNNQLELFVNGTSDTVGQIDLYGDEPISLSISVADIKDISKRNSTFSQTFTIPATKNNNILLNHIFNIGADATFDPSKKTPCYMLNDSIPIFNGNFQLTKINVKNRNVVSYECVVYGDTIDLVKTLGDKLIRGNSNSELDIDFSELNHNRTSANIEASWFASTKDLGYYYPLIDYGYDLSVSELNSGVLSIDVDSGTATSGTSNTLTDSTKIWAINAFTTYQVYIASGQGVGQTRTISSNNGITLTVSVPWTVVPNNTSVYTITRIDNSNPYSTTGNGLNPAIFKPAISNTYLFKKILANNGFSLDSTFIDSEIFAETIIPFNGTDNLDKGDIKTFKAFLTEPLTIINTGSLFPPAYDLPFDNDSVNGGFDYSNLYNPLSHKYIADTPGVQQFMVDLSYGYNTANFIPGTATVDSWYIRFYRSSLASGVGSLPYVYCQVNYRVDKIPAPAVVYDIMPHKSFTVFGPILDNGITPAPVVPGIGGTVYTNNAWRYPAQAGEIFWVEVSIANQTSVYHILDEGTAFYNKVYTDGIINNYIEFNDFIPKNIKQIDYIKSVITLFNLMVIPDKNNPRRLKFIPRTEYYTNGQIKNWTSKVDHTDKIESTLISEQQNKNIKFSYKPDKDFYNTNYTDKLNIVFGEYVETLDNEWIDGEKKIDVIFSPTPVDKVFGSTDIFIPKIAKRDAKTGIYGATDFNIRFLRKNSIPRSTVNTLQLVGSSPVNYYPYCGHLDQPLDSTIDYNFGTIKFSYYPELTTITNNNLVELYWKDYLEDITDKNSRIIKCKIYLTPNDIAQFNYNDSIFIDGLTDDGGHYFIVNKITYIPTSNQPSVVELIKVNRKPREKRGRHIFTEIPVHAGPVKSLEFGKENFINSGTTLVNGNGNSIGFNSTGSVIIGDNNIIPDNVNHVVIINGNNHTVTESFVTIVGNTYFAPDGSSFILYNDIESGQDTVINPFSTQPYNDFNLGQDAVLNFGSTSAIKDVDSQEDKIF